jgi:hypothetical protein
VKLNVKNGCVGLICCYAPHNLRPFDERAQFYVDLGRIWGRTSVNAGRFLFGDFNARIGQARLGEEHAFGPYGYGLEAQHQVEVPNRDLLFDFCTSYNYAVGNMMQWTPPGQKATFADAM